MSSQDIARQLKDALGIDTPTLDTVAEMDPELAREFAGMARAVRDSNALTPKDQALIYVAFNSALVHLNAEMVRAYIAAAIRAGATAGEIREVLQLTSVIGIHGTIPGAQIMAEDEGGLDKVKKDASADRKAAAAEAHAAFQAKRGALTPAWETNTWFVPELVKTYANFSGVPWATEHLSPKMKELVYIAIDLLPQHVHLGGIRVHMKKARANGASEAEIVSIVQMVALMGIQTHTLALPILKEELLKAGKPLH